MHTTRHILIVVVLATAFTLAANAAEVIKPQIGEPLRDAMVTRAPDGTYYLTGTRAITQKQVLDPKTGKTSWEQYLAKTADGKPDFMSNDGLKLWSSKDLMTWKDEGFALDLFKRPGWRNDPLLQFYFLPERPLGARMTRALTTPRIRVIGGEWFITFSMLGRDVRWLRASSATGPWNDGRLHDGKPPGEENGPRSLRHVNGPGAGDLFADTDGSVWLVWGPGYLAKVNAALQDIEHETTELLLAKVAGYPNAEWCARQFDPRAFSLTRKDGKYLLTWSAFTDEGGVKREDSFVAVAERLGGPYSEPQLLVAGSGPVTLFEAGERGWMVACSMDDAPVLLPFQPGSGRQEARPAVKSAAPQMHDYARSKPTGQRAVRAGVELKYQMLPVFAEKPSSPEERAGRYHLVPVFDMPIADVSICKGADAWYLTGTVASKQRSEVKGQKSEAADFQNNDGIYLWRSTDLDTWLPLGKVWDIEKEGSTWVKQYRIPGNNPVRTDFCRGVTAPEIHFADNTYWIAYSMNGRGTGLLKSKTGKAEGPYQDLGRLTGMGESPSLFTDTDGTTYWLWGKGLQIAPLTKERSRLAGAPRDLLTAFIAFPPSGWDGLNRSHWWDVTGPHLFVAMDPKTKQRRYALAFSAVTQTFQRANRDTLVAVADRLDGLFQAAVRMIPHGGETTVFAGPQEQLWASFSGSDPSAVFRDRASLVPMEWYELSGIQWPRMVQGDYYTIRGPWAELMPPAGGVPGTRDINVFKDKDGYYYYSGSGVSGPVWDGGARFWRAKDLFGPWEDIGFLYTMEEMRDDPDWPEIKDEKDKSWNNAKHAWEPELSFGQGTYWLSMWFGGHGWGKDVCWKKSIGALLRSTSGKITGPYKLHSQWPGDFQGLLWEGEVAYGRSGAGTIWRMTPDLKGVDPTWTDRDGRPLKGWPSDGMLKLAKMSCGRLFSEDCGTTFYKLGGKYVSGGLTHHCGYDAPFAWADDLRGPWHYMGVVPNLGNAPVVQNRDGKWYTIPQCGNRTVFATPYRETDKTIPTDLFLYEVVFDMNSPTPSVWPAHDLKHLNEAVYRW